MGSVENEQNCWRYYGVAHWRQEHTVQWRVSTCSQWKVKPASCWFYPINDLSGFDTFISFPLSNLLGELRWAVMPEKMPEPSVLAGKEESDCFPFFGLACGMQAVRKCGKEIPTGEEKITNIPFTASFLCHLLPFLFLSVWLRGAGELHTLPGV